MKYLITILTITSCSWMAYGQAKLKQYEDKSKGGYESIVFENSISKNADGSERKETAEYRLEEHNPYKKSGFKTRNGSPNLFKFAKQEAAEVFKLHPDKISSEEITARTFFWAKTNENYGIVSYNLFGHDEHGEAQGLRKSTIKVVDENALEVSSTDLDTDSYSLVITTDGKYLGYGYGEVTHDVEPNERGYRILNVKTNEIVADFPVNIVTYSYTKYDYIIVRGILSSSYTWIFNCLTTELHKIEGRISPESRTSFKKDGSNTIFNDLTPFKIK